MNRNHHADSRRPSVVGLWIVLLLVVVARSASAQSVSAPPAPDAAADQPPTTATATQPPTTTATQAATTTTEGKTRLEIYGYVMLDTINDFEVNDPLWFDVVRPTKLPAFENEFGEDGHWWMGVRQTRFGVKSYTPTKYGELKTIFEYELFGTGVDAGQTTFRLRHAWGELGQWGAGQTWSLFMDPDVFPNSIEYWGPNGMIFFRNVQLRWTPWSKDNGSRFAVAIERPGASADQGDFAGRIELQNVLGRFPAPDVTAQYRHARDWGHVQLAGIFRVMRWDDILLTDRFNLSGGDEGWGINVSSNVKLGKHVARLQAAYGEGVENYFNDAPVDVGIRNNFSNPVTPIIGEALPDLGIVAFIDLNWSDEWTSTAGYSMVDIKNTDGQTELAFHRGHYALGNLLWHPTKSVMAGGELQWGKRVNVDGFTSDDWRIQFSVRWNFFLSVGGQ